MSIKLDYSVFFHLVMLYPFALSIFTAIGKDPFFITAPYFLAVMIFLIVVILFRKKISFNLWEITQLFLAALLILVSIYNFSTIRYSLPILFTVYIFILQIFLTKYSKKVNYTDFKYFKHYFFFYIFLSVFFILLPLSPTQQVFRFEGFLGSPTVYSAYLVLLYILAIQSFKSLKEKLFWYLIVLTLVFLSKTRLILLLMLFLPLLFFAIETLKLSLKKIFLITFIILLFLYPAYKVVVDYFPNLVTIRYQIGKDKSYDLRLYLYTITQDNFLMQPWETKILGQGNEHSRLLVKRNIGLDIYPHNDFIRLINDWGVLGGFLFFIFIFRYGVNSKIALMVAIIYLIQFYSNLVFNLFLISILMSISNLSGNVKIQKIKE